MEDRSLRTFKPLRGAVGGRTPAMSAAALARPLFLLAVLLAALSPMLLHPLGIAGDYPNHLARVYIEHRLAGSAALQEHFTLDWGIYPDLAMDLFMRPLMRVTDPYTAGAAFNVVAAAMLPVGVALLSWATTGRVGLPVAASVLLIYGKPLAWGLINFVFTSGLALCLLALWIRLSPGWSRTALFTLAMPVLFFSHALGFLLFGFLMLAYEIGRFIGSERGTLSRFAAGLILRDGLIAVVPLALFAASLPERLSGLQTQFSGFGGLASRGQAFLAPFDFDIGPASALLIAGCYLTIYTAFRQRYLTLAPAMWPVFLASVVLVLFVPAAFSGISLLHIRFGAIPAAILLAGASLTQAGRAHAVPLFAAFASLLALQTVFVYNRLALLDHALGQVREAVSALPEGARVLIGADSLTSMVIHLNHAPAFAVIEADGYVANLFTNTSPVGVSALAMPLHQPQAWPLSRERLLEGARLAPLKWAETNGSANNYNYYHGWPRTFDALFWFTEPGGAALDSAYLKQIAGDDFFRLYAILPSAE